MPNAGDKIGRFVLERQLGRGPLSQVFLAVEPATMWKVAYKFFVLEPGSKPADYQHFAERMVREAAAAAAFVHENVVKVHEVGLLGTAPYLVRDYIEGRSLEEHIGSGAASGPAVTLEWKIHWLRTLAQTLGAIHRAGLVHRDVKPSNVLVRRDGALRVLDFGVARRSVDRAAGISPPVKMGATERLPGAPRPRVLGTPAYLAPERFANQGASPSTDQFSWGVLAFELLTGRLPWVRGDKAASSRPVQMIEAILTQAPPSVRLAAPELPPGVDAVLARAMAKLPSSRFTTMDEALAAFDAALRR